MRSVSKWYRRRAGILIAGAALVLAIAILHPWYVRYMTRYNSEVCEKARFVLEDRYNHRVEEQMKQGVSLNDIDYEDALRQAVRQEFGADLTAVKSGEYEVKGICRAGGTYTIYMDPSTHRIKTHCSYPGHGDYQMFTTPFGAKQA
ncbi:MAG: hypothetical protein PUC46_00805 [Lachnospiraceae bacterium]|nr:hypothetical protein [Lachnospiraceae bacterium]